MLFERRGKARLYGTEVEACKESSFDAHSFAGDEADIWESELIHSRVQGEARVRAATLEHSSVGVMAGQGICEVTASVLNKTEFINGTCLGSYIENSIVHGTKVAIRNSVVRNSDIIGNVILDNADIDGLVLKGKMRLTGKWTRPPRYFHMKNEIADIGITESHDGKAFVGCREKDMSRWIKGKRRYCRAAGWPIEMGDTLEKVFREWLG